MGNKDNVLRKYITGSVFADIFNTVVFHGKQVIDPEQLHEIDSVTSEVWLTEAAVPQELETDERRRDIIKMAEFQDQAFILLGVENQDKPDQTMPLRVMEYDVRTYRRQLAEHPKDKLKPVVTLVIYWSPSSWNAPRSLKDMMDARSIQQFEESSGGGYIQDYALHLYEPAGSSREQLAEFQTEIGDILGYVKYSKDSDQLKAYIEERQMRLRTEAVDVINVITKSDIPYQKDQEVVDMCVAIREIREEGVQQGIEVGREEEKIRLLANLMVNTGLSYEKACFYCGILAEDWEKYREKVELLVEEIKKEQE